MTKRVITKFLCMLLVISQLLVLSTTQLCVYAVETTNNEAKIDNALKNRLDEMNTNDKVNVSVWLNDIDHTMLKEQVKTELHDEICNNEIPQVAINNMFSDSLESKTASLTATANNIMQSTPNLNDTFADVTTEQIQNLIETEREVASDMYTQKNAEIFDELFPSVSWSWFSLIDVEQPELVYSCKYVPNIHLVVSKEQVYSMIDSDLVDSVYLNEEDYVVGNDMNTDLQTQTATVLTESDINLVWQKNTGIEEARNNYGLDGTGVKIGQMEELAVRTTDTPVFNYSLQNNKLYNDYDENYYVSPISNDSHANYVASVMVGYKENLYFGAAYNAKLYSVSKYSETTHQKGEYDISEYKPSEWKERLEWLIDDGVNIINLSTGFIPYPGNDIIRWFDHIVSMHKISVVSSTGNFQKSEPGRLMDCSLGYNVIGVGNINDNNTTETTDDVIHETSSHLFGNTDIYKPDIVAPGHHAGTAFNPLMSGGGTSAAAPIVTSVAALLMQYSPILKTNPALLKAILLNGTRTLAVDNVMNSNATYNAFKRDSGAGVVNAIHSLNLLKSFNYEYGMFRTTSTDITSSFYVPSTNLANRKVRVTLSTIVDGNLSYHNGSENLSLKPIYFQVTVTGPGTSTDKWTSRTYYDSKVSVVFTPPKKGTYSVTVTRLDSQYNPVVRDVTCAISYDSFVNQ